MHCRFFHSSTLRSSLRFEVLRVVLVALFYLGAALCSPAFAQGPAFKEVAASVGLDFEHYNGMIGKLYFPEMTGAGVAVFDMDNDGDLDIYFGQGNLFEPDKVELSIFEPPYTLPTGDRLYRNELISSKGVGELRFVDVTERAGLGKEATGYNMGVAAGDIDNDGFVDLYLSNMGSNHLLHNNGDGTFTDIALTANADDRRWTVAASFLDYDRDGFLDIFVGNYIEFRYALHKDCTSSTGALDYCGPLSYPLLPNLVLRNKGDLTFERVTEKVLEGNPVASTLGTVTGDFNDDGWIDIYVANDLVPNHLWINQKDGTFLDDALFSGAAVDSQGHPQASMGVVAGDLDGDGHEDLFMTHLRMEMNMVYINDGTGFFEDNAMASGLGRSSFAYTGFGTALFDYDNDTEVDVYIANGAVKRVEEQIREGVKLPLHESNLLYRGLGEGRFEEVETAQRVDQVHSDVSRGVAMGDLDNDGDTDLVISNNAGPGRLLLNQVGSSAPWMGVRLALASGRDALGAKVELVRKDARSLFRRVRTDGSYVSANDPRLLFGVGAAGADGVVGLKVRWPDGKEETFSSEQLKLQAYVTLVQGTAKGQASSAGSAP